MGSVCSRLFPTPSLADQTHSAGDFGQRLSEMNQDQIFAHEKVKQTQFIFHKRANTNKINEIKHKQQYKDLLNSQTWTIRLGGVNSFSSDLLGITQECKGIQSISVVLNPKDMFLNFEISFSQIRFIDLMKLNLSYCRLEGIEFLTQIQMPNLKQLWIQNNYITSITPLRRMNCKFSILNLTSNPIINFKDGHMHMISFANTVETLNFEERHNYCGEDFSWFFKLNIKQLGRYSLDSQKRIKCSKRINNMVKKLFKKKDNQLFGWGPICRTQIDERFDMRLM